VERLKKLHNEKLNNLYFSSNITRIIKSRRMRWVGHVARFGEMRNSYKILVGQPEGKRSYGRPRCRWEDNIRMGVCESVKVWIGCIWLRISTSGQLL
jgi:hypothetical protein